MSKIRILPPKDNSPFYKKPMFFVVEIPTPVLNTPDFSFAFGGKEGNQVPTNEKGHSYLVEFVALKGMIFFLDAVIPNSPIYQVSFSSYPLKKLYIDSRFGKLIPEIQTFAPLLPPPSVILSRMKKLLGKPYVWGGNWSRGIPQMLNFYPPQKTIDLKTKTLWTLEGVDCSGLLYEATLGATPRNTKELLSYGNPLKISNLNFSQILSLLQPLDMILYPGHVLFVEDEMHTIESKSPFGVIERDLKERLDEIFQERKPIDDLSFDLNSSPFFLIRRIDFHH